MADRVDIGSVSGVSNALVSQNILNVKKEECQDNSVDEKVDVSGTSVAHNAELQDYICHDKIKQYELSTTLDNIKIEFSSFEGREVQNDSVKMGQGISAHDIKIDFDNGMLYCEHCEAYYEDYCIECGMLTHILNKNAMNSADKGARATIPNDTLDIQDCLGQTEIYAMRIIPVGVKFGPFTGLSAREFPWEMKGEKFVLDKNKNKYLNWMQYVNPTRNTSDHNLRAVQCEENIYYQSTRQIQAGEELLVYFGEEYSNSPNNLIRLDFDTIKKDIIKDVFACTFCCLGFSSKSHLAKHKTLCVEGTAGRFSIEELTQCPFCKIQLDPKEYSEHHMPFCCDRNARVNSHQLTFAAEKEIPKLNGYRIVDIRYLFSQTVSLQYDHSKQCTGGKLMYHEEIRSGLVSTFTYKCNVCNECVSIRTEKATEDTESIVNTAAVWGTLATGSSYAHLEERLSILDIPPLSGRHFFDTQRRLGFLFKDSLWEEMEAAGKEEYKIAREKGDVDQDGLAHITVCLDGGWSKRSYGHNYNAASGVAVIIGKCTGKVLYVGVRNKYCCCCARAENKNETVKEHICFKNWTGSSGSMEQDIIVEGFNMSEEMHHLRYKRFIADGDATVDANIHNRVSYGSEVTKIECTNHCIKNYGKNLHKMKADIKGVPLSIRKLLTTDVIKSLSDTAQKAIYANAHGDVAQLKEDLRNSIFHVFGNHQKCTLHMCDKVGDVASDRTALLIETGAHHHLYAAMHSVLVKANMLIDNETNNRAELFMSILARFNMGKRLNVIQRDSFQIRSYLTGLRYNKGEEWHLSSWKKAFNKSPGKILKKYVANKMINKMKRKQTPYRKPKFVKSLQYAKDDQQCTRTKTQKQIDYGANISSVEMSNETLNEEVDELIKRLKVSETQQQDIFKTTTEQFESARYRSERMHRLTASNFGAVYVRKEFTSCHVLVDKILGGTRQTSDMLYGKTNEKLAINQFVEQIGKPVYDCGLWIDLKYSFLAASPDGITEDRELVEVKCLPSIVRKDIPFHRAVTEKLVPYLRRKECGKIYMKKEHAYYYQIQGQLGITGCQKCHLVVYSGPKNDLYTEVIEFDRDLWERMLTKLVRFYKQCLTSEIILERRKKGLRCRDPQYILDAQKLKTEKQGTKKK